MNRPFDERRGDPEYDEEAYEHNMKDWEEKHPDAWDFSEKKGKHKNNNKKKNK